MKNLSVLTLWLACWAMPVHAAKLSDATTEICGALTQNTADFDIRALTANLVGSRLEMESVKARLERYTGEAPLGDGSFLKERGSKDGREKTRVEIEAELKFFGYESQREEFEKGANIIASIRGTEFPDEILEITAHYDSVGNPGADDNGSGLALVMELARMMKLYPPKRTVRFVFMDLEEAGFHGSLHHAERLSRAQENLVGVLVLDTIAWANDATEQQLVVLEAGTEGMARTSDEYIARVRFAQNLLYPLSRINRDGGKLRISIETAASAPRTADHGSYWRYGLPAVLIGEAFEDGLITPFYHSPEDRTTHVNWAFYEEVARTVLEMVAYVSSAQPMQHDEAVVLDIAAILDRENIRFDGSIAWPPSPLARGPFLTAKQRRKLEKQKPDQDHLAAVAVLDRAFVLGDLGQSAAVVVAGEGSEGMWLVGEKMGVFELSHLSKSAKMEVAAEVAYFGGPVWAVDSENPDSDFLADLRDERVNGADKLPELPYVVARRDLPSQFWSPEMYTGTNYIERKTTLAKLSKILNDTSRDSVLALARRRADGEEFLGGLLLIRNFDQIEITEVELSWEDARKMKEELAVRRDGLPPMLLFTGADFEDEWQDEIVPHLWNASGRLKLDQNGVRFKAEF